MDARHRNLNVLVPCFVGLAIMCGLVAYSPELYRAFCGATGYGGTTQRAYTDPTTMSQQTVTVAFDSNVAPGLPWRFEPEQRSVTVHLGEQKLVFFSAENLDDKTTIGHATFNVTPPTSGIYFNKIQCFCFNEERLDSHQKVDMPVVFYVDPAFAKDPDMDHVDTITLSYTFGRSASPTEAKNLSRFLANAAPDAVHGLELFTQRCNACHALDKNMIGPMLSGVVGRPAASAVGYNYSSALKNAHLTWSQPNWTNGWPILRNWCPEQECRFACSMLRLATISSPTCRRLARRMMTQRTRKRLHRDPNTKLDLEISVPRDSGVAVKR